MKTDIKIIFGHWSRVEEDASRFFAKVPNAKVISVSTACDPTGYLILTIIYSI